MKFALIAVLSCTLASCMAGQQFSKGFTEEGFKQVVDTGLSVLEAKLGEKVDGLGVIISELPKPKPSNPGDGTIWYGLGALIAYVVGSLGKGYIRDKMGSEPSS